MIHRIAGVHEIAGVGTIFPDAQGKPSLHLHAALGRGGAAVAGCTWSSACGCAGCMAH